MGGFSMVEVMVTVIVVVFGLLGLVKMQGLAISATANSSRRGLAAIEADSLANAMQVNHAYWAQGLVSTISISNGTISDGTLGLETAVNCTSGNNAPCTSTQIAAYDLQQWSASLTTLLPTPSATISCSAFTANAPVTCTIQISWVENTVAVNTQGSNTAAMAAPSYTLFVQP